MSKNSIQIDVKSIHEDTNTVVCYLYTQFNTRATRIVMTIGSYQNLKLDGFFIRPTETPDSAGILNTTYMFYEERGGNK